MNAHTPWETNRLSPGVIDPWAQLAAGVLCQAFADLDSNDPVVWLDAFTWLLDTGLKWLEILGFSVDANACLKAAGGFHAKKGLKNGKKHDPKFIA